LGIPIGKERAILKSGKEIEINGKKIRPEEVLEEEKRGRKIVILGDTSNSDHLIPYAKNCDILVHECTSEEEQIEIAKSRGHSTISMASKFAQDINAQKLVLTHFGKRFCSHTGQVKILYFFYFFIIFLLFYFSD
jgi:ribonuclease Z